ncbi:VOC family protein [Pseudomonas marincola]|uniref:VOC family protein n=1 Tax=Pseudomonas marincola TaxID=437900 RepID=UPI0008F2210A|nr:VOC family protein [Pseudomonas marincola]SFU17081.1 PhnB protein [Pseudomonas marincola]
MKINPYLMFDGQAEAAFQLYAKVLKGEIKTLMRYRETPECAEMPEPFLDRVMHVCLEVDGQLLMASDTASAEPFSGMKGCSITLNVASISEAQRVFDTLSEQGTVEMPLAQTFWAVRFGSLVDRFGVSWLINCEKDDA